MSVLSSMRLMAMLPQLFRTGNLIIRALQDRKLSTEETQEIVNEFRELIKSIPELKAFLAIFDSLVKVAAVVLPTFLGDKAKAIALGLQQEELSQALAVAQLMQNITAEAVKEAETAKAKLKDDDVEDMI